MILAWTGDELSCRQAQNGVTFDFEVKFDLEGQGQSPPKTIGILTKVFYTYGPNLVILALMGDELSRRQASDYYTHGWTDADMPLQNFENQEISGKKPGDLTKNQEIISNKFLSLYHLKLCIFATTNT